jgi:DNA-binding transcriptional ArsR family regulator
VISKHLAVLRKAGIVTQNRTRLYQINPQFRADRDKRIIDLGWCLLRMRTGQ